MESIEQRLETLERRFLRAQWSNRVLAFALAAVICAAGAQLSSPQTLKTPRPGKNQQENQIPKGQGGLRTVEAERIVLVDKAGQSRVTMAVIDNGSAISMFDEHGCKKLELNQSAASAGISLFLSDETPVASLQFQNNGDRAQLELEGLEGRTLIGASGFEVRDRDDHSRALLALINGNFPVLGLNNNDQKGPHSVEITAGDNGLHGFKMHDRTGRPLFSVSAAKEGTHLQMRHPEHERLLQISAGPEQQEGPQIAFFDSAKSDGTGGLLARLRLGLHMDGQPYIRIVDRDGSPVFTAPAK